MSGLDGLRVLVTRPLHQAQTLCGLIEAEGGESLSQPLFSIEAVADPDAVAGALRAAGRQRHDLIFTSANAVTFAWSAVPNWRPAGRLAAIGAATHVALKTMLDDEQAARIISPDTDFRSEGLLALPSFQRMKDRHVSLVTGEGGRNKLAGELEARGAQVSVLAVYRRVACEVSEARMQMLLEQADVAVVTSGEALLRLVRLAPPGMDSRLRTLQLVVPSTRVLKMALELGFTQRPLLPEQMNNEAMVAALRRWAELGGRA